MSTPSLTHLTALHLSGAGVPDWIQLTPAGPEAPTRDGRVFRMPDPQAVVDAFNTDGISLPVDIDHATELAPAGTPAPAVGQIEQMEVRDGAIWGRVSWTEAGAELMRARAYRYVSPAVLQRPDTGEITRLRSAALVHRPNLAMAGLYHQQQQENADMDKAILEALGLHASATAAEVVVAITKLKETQATALHAAQHPDPERFVPKADHDAALTRIRGFEAEEQTRAEAAVHAAVDAAIEAGKIVPASREFHVAACQAGGVEKFAAMVADLPVIAGGKSKPAPAKTETHALNDDELTVCRQLGIAPADFAKSKGAA
jgi:phage I-like protein